MCWGWDLRVGSQRWQQTCHIGCETLDDVLAKYQHHRQYRRHGGAGQPGRVLGSTGTGISACTRRALCASLSGPFGVALGTARVFQGGVR